MHHKPDSYCGWKKTNSPLPPIVWTPHGEPLSIEPSLAFYSLSPFFDWGYDGDGPSQLALAVLLHHTGDEQRSLKHYEDFKDYRVARWDNTWWLGDAELKNWLKDRERR